MPNNPQERIFYYAAQYTSRILFWSVTSETIHEEINIALRKCRRDESGALFPEPGINKNADAAICATSKFMENYMPSADPEERKWDFETLMRGGDQDAESILNTIDEKSISGDMDTVYRGNFTDFLTSEGEDLNQSSRNSIKAATEIERALNRVYGVLNSAEIAPAERRKLAIEIFNRTLNAVTYTHGNRHGIRQKKAESFFKALEAERKKSLAKIAEAAHGTKIPVSLQTGMLDGAEAELTPRKKLEDTSVYKKVIQLAKTKAPAGTEEQEFQLLIFEELDRAKQGLFHQATGNQIADIVYLLAIRQKAYHFAKTMGVSEKACEPVDMRKNGFNVKFFFPKGLKNNAFSIAANDLLKAMGRPYEGQEGKRERKNLIREMEEAATLTYRDRAGRAASTGFIFAPAMKKRTLYLTFNRIDAEFFIPEGVQFNVFREDAIAYVYDHWKGTREKAGDIIKCLTALNFKLHKENRRISVKQKNERAPLPAAIEVEATLSELYWPRFRTKEENEAARGVLLDALNQIGISAEIIRDKNGAATAIKISAPFEFFNPPTNPKLLSESKK